MTTKADLTEKRAILQRDRETYAIVPHIPGGIITDTSVLKKIIDVAEKYEAQALKLTSAQRIAIVGIKEEKVEAAWQDLGMDMGNAIGLCVRNVKICPATHFCKRAIQDGVTVGLEIDKRYQRESLPGKMKIGISGCPNDCAEACIKDIGLIGARGGFKVSIGGNGGVRPRLSLLFAENVSPEEVIPLLDKIISYYKENAKPHERIGAMTERLTLEKVKQDILN
ncbi:NAD(P)/FAD-dependent oxidoreductase [Selenomonadales bacterium OttesenSCG-928-I06]|nr:NAD(P)/FAD-dependent oxidoreductase [Selenomonadales bacterium OttesenSCG-928-I06]